MLFREVGFGRELVTLQYNNRWLLEIEDNKGTLQGYATIDAGTTYQFGLTDAGQLIMESDAAANVPATVREKLLSLLRAQPRTAGSGIATWAS